MVIRRKFRKNGVLKLCLEKRVMTSCSSDNNELIGSLF